MSDSPVEEESSSRQFWIPFARNKYFSFAVPDPTAVGWLDNELDALAEVTRLVKRRRNDCAPYSRLPQEVLVDIFRVLSNINPPKYGRLGWILVTHVCQSWRELALDNPSLWINLPCSDVSAAWASEIMRRCRQAPLRVEVITPMYGYHPARQLPLKILADVMESHSNHLRYLKLAGADVMDYFTPLYHRKALPELETLVVVGSSTSDTAILRVGFLAKHAPKLKELYLKQSMPSSIPTRLLPNLTQFSLTIADGDVNPSFPLLKGTLECMPSLEKLCLDGILPEDFPEPGTSDLTIVLPSSLKLVEFAIRHKSGISPSLRLYRALSAPYARWSMTFDSNLPPSSLAHLLSSGEPHRSSAVDVIYDDRNGLNFNFYHLALLEPDASSNDICIPAPALSVSVTRAVTGHAFDALVRAIPGWSYVSIFTYRDNEGSSKASQARWLTVAKSATEVRRLRIKGSQTVLSFLRLLTDFRDESAYHDFVDSPSEPSRVQFFPKLTSLTFFEDNSGSLGNSLARTEERLLAALSLRRIYRIPIPELKIPLDKLPSGLLERLKQEVPAINMAEDDKF